MLRLDGLKIPLNYDEEALWQKAASTLRVPVSEIASLTLVKRSLDARNKRDIHFVAAVRVVLHGNEEAVLHRRGNKRLYREQIPSYTLPAVHYDGDERPLVVGGGPAGLFGALVLAMAGLQPLVIEGGRPIPARKQDVAAFLAGESLLPASNIQFGEGGAGAFSDGKLTTGTRDPRHHFILETFVRAGAPEEIRWQAKPHIGSDYLAVAVPNLRRRIEELGGSFLFESWLTDIDIRGGRLAGVCLQQPKGEQYFSADRLLLACGHSARATYRMLHHHRLALAAKKFAIGLRIEHRRQTIDESQYGRTLPTGAADYKLAVHLPTGRSVYTFCMCPGGVVVPAASTMDGVVTNGMSLFARDAVNSNSALLVNVGPADFEDKGPLAGIAFQERWEEAAFRLAGGGWAAPVQTVGDFLGVSGGRDDGTVTPSYRPAVVTADLRRCLPPFVTASLAAALPLFDRKLRGFAAPSAVLTGVETRSSSPLRILRDESGQSSVGGLYPAGEGAGYAGGIMSSAADGMRAAEAILGAQ